MSSSYLDLLCCCWSWFLFCRWLSVRYFCLCWWSSLTGRNHSGWELWLWNQCTGCACSHIYYGKKRQLQHFNTLSFPVGVWYISWLIVITRWANLKPSRSDCGPGLSQFHTVSVFLSTCIFQFILSVVWHETALHQGVQRHSECTWLLHPIPLHCSQCRKHCCC